MTIDRVEAQPERKQETGQSDRRELVGLVLLGAGVFTTLATVTLAGLTVIYLFANGDIFPSSDCVLRVYYFCGVPVWAIVVSAVAAIVFGLWLLMILRVLFMSFDMPEGVEVTADEAPGLFALIDRIAGEHRAAKLDAVIIDAECNAGIVGHPALGVFGKVKRNLIIGLPLLDAIDERELPILLEHEMAHLAEHNGLLELSSHRITAIWGRIGSYCALGWVPFGGLLGSFAASYLDRVDAVGLRLSRRNELSADAAAASGHTATASAAACLRFAAASIWFEKMWELFPSRLRRHGEPRFRPFHVLPRWFRRLHNKDRFERLVRIAMAQSTSKRDTHPAWQERVAALGPDPQTPPPVEVPASRILGAFEMKLRDEMHALWLERVSDTWCEHHESAKLEEEELVYLERQAADGKIAPEDARAMAHLTRDFHGAAKALPLYRALVERDQDDAEMQFCLGEVLLDLGDADGLQHLDRARNLDPGLSVGVVPLASDFLASNGDLEAARAYSAGIDLALDEFELAADERESLTHNDVLEPHCLDGASLTQIRERVASVPGVKRAWLARKRVERLRARPCLVLLVEYDFKRLFLGTADMHHERLIAACSELQRDFIFIRHNVSTRQWKRTIEAVPGSAFFDRSLPVPASTPEAVQGTQEAGLN